LATIEKDSNGIGFIHVENVLNPNMMPYGARYSQSHEIDDDITRWNDSRCIPLGRPNYIKLLEILNASSTSELIPSTYMCSLTDCYWFKPSNSNLLWGDVNFRDNGFDSTLYKHLFYGDNSEPLNNLHSPDLTTNGAIPKMWESTSDGNFVLLKSSLGKIPMDVYNEVIADAILSELRANHVRYRVENRDGIDYSACKCFIHSNDEEFVPAENFLFDGCYNSTSQFLEHMREIGFERNVDEMILADAIIGNTDRHAGNYGVVLDSDTQFISRFAPLFDHGGCELFKELGMIKYKPTNKTFDETLQDLDPEILALAKRIDMSTIEKTIRALPIDEPKKNAIVYRLNERVDKIIDLSRGIDYDLDRRR
jgi:hypothetical protein